MSRQVFKKSFFFYIELLGFSSERLVQSAIFKFYLRADDVIYVTSFVSYVT